MASPLCKDLKVAVDELVSPELQGHVDVIPVTPVSPATSTMHVDESVAPSQSSDVIPGLSKEVKNKLGEGMFKAEELISQLYAHMGGMMTTLKDVNDKGKRDDGKDVVDVKKFMMHIAKNTIRYANWMSDFVYRDDLRKAPVMMEGYQGRDEHFDSDVELLGASSDSSIRSIPLGFSKGGGRGKKDGKKRINRNASTAIPAADPYAWCV